MERTVTVSLDEAESGYVDEQFATGRFASASEAVRTGLALLRERDAKLEALRQALIEGEESGPAGPLDIEDIKRKARGTAARAA